MRRLIASTLLFVSLLSCVSLTTSQGTQNAAAIPAAIPTPAEVLGFVPGDDRKLASWKQIVEYFERLDAASDRVKFETLGQTSMNKPFVMATISSPANLAKLDEYKQIQAQLADPRKLGPPGVRGRKSKDLIARGKTIVLITCGIHSTEVGSYLSSTLIAHRLASSNEPEIQSILDNTIVLLVPSLNPDGVDIVKDWYDKTLGTPYEGTDPPELYHKYTGHDNNRDWYAFTQVETQLTVDKIHNVWRPQIVHDIHQQGSFGSRLFLPPYMAPVEPNVPRQIIEGYTQLGEWMSGEMRAKGFEGITTNSTYDAWTPARAYSHYHAGVRILSETASAKIATPITLKFDELRSREGYDPQKESPNFGPVWKGGEWKLRDITKYMTNVAFLLLKHSAEYRSQWLLRFYAIGREAVRPRRPGELLGFIVEPSTNCTDMLTPILERGGVEFTPLPDGKRFIRIDQPYGAFAKALLEVQRYPNLRDAQGHPIAPYDVTAHTLPLLMNVNVKAVKEPFRSAHSKSDAKKPAEPPAKSPCPRPATDLPALYRAAMPTYDEGWTRWLFENLSVRYGVLTEKELRAGKTTYSMGPGVTGKYYVILFPDQSPRNILEGYRSGAMPPEISGGLGEDGVKQLRAFIVQGGTVVFLNRASEFAIDQLKLPLRNVVGGLPRTDFYVPGSILRIELDTTHPIAKDMPKETIAWAENSPVFEVVENPGGDVPAANVRVIGRYPEDKDPLLSGWLLGADRIKGKAALVEVTMGKGRVILFGFRPQYRAQSTATYPLLFNSLATNP
ncbi:MAG TPA: M14 metallopeptidase family protein [Pyrinomonadaceae bacterium]|nr:M14 metallopeptidase family protein [Pyrinomonadaceae bacterium]